MNVPSMGVPQGCFVQLAREYNGIARQEKEKPILERFQELLNKQKKEDKKKTKNGFSIMA